MIEGLSRYGLEPSSIDYAIATHGHSDHLGNLNLFLEATHIVGFTISKNNEFFEHPFDKGKKKNYNFSLFYYFHLHNRF